LFQRAVTRAAALPDADGRPIGFDGVYVIVDRRHAALVREQTPFVPSHHVLTEPEGRNTAAAIALATLAIERAMDDVMLVLPADAWISNDGAFQEVVGAATHPNGLVAEGTLGVHAPLVTIGVQPDRPETGYGYLVPASGSETEVHGLRAYRLQAFIEKPDLGRATSLVQMPGVAWNAGMFAWRRSAIHSALQSFAPDILAAVSRAMTARRGSDEGGRLSGPSAVRRYREVRATSIDYAVMEPAGERGIVLMGSMDAGWSDVGSWAALRDLDGRPSPAGTDGRREAGLEPDVAAATQSTSSTLDIGSRDLLVRSAGGRLIVTVGLSDMIVVDTPDALLVCAGDRTQLVRTVVERLREAGEAKYL
jgi:mannose-1-phosphate guanylyltransferase